MVSTLAQAMRSSQRMATNKIGQFVLVTLTIGGFKVPKYNQRNYQILLHRINRQFR
jgi:hypothetical protein